MILIDSFGFLWIPLDSYGFPWIPMGACGGGDNYLFFGITVRDNTVGAGGVRYSIVDPPLGQPGKADIFNAFE